MSSENFKNFQHLTTSDSAAFWRRVNQLIKAQKRTQEDVARDISVNYATFRNWSHRKTYPELTDIHHMAQALNTTMNYLIFGTEIEPSTQAVHVLGKKIMEVIHLLIMIVKSTK